MSSENTITLTVNGGRARPFKTYITDTIESVRTRIAAEVGSVPRWMTFSRTTTIDREIFEDVHDLLSRVRESSSMIFPRDLALPPTVSRTEALTTFIATNANTRQDPSTVAFILLELKKSLSAEDRSLVDVDDAWKNRREHVKTLDKEIAVVASAAKEFSERAEFFEQISTVQCVGTEIERVSVTLDLGEWKESLTSLFDSLIVSKHVPYAAVAYRDTFVYRIYRDFTPHRAWLDLGGQNIIILKPINTNDDATDVDEYAVDDTVSYTASRERQVVETGQPSAENIDKTSSPQTEFKSRRRTAEFCNSALAIRSVDIGTDDRGTVALTSEGKSRVGRNNHHLLVTIDMKIGPMYAKKDDIVRRVLACIGRNAVVRKQHEINVVSRFVLPNRCLTLDVLSDLAMNDSLFVDVVAIDEFARASKVKKDLFIHVKSTGDVVSVQNAFDNLQDFIDVTKVAEATDYSTNKPFVKCRARTTTVNGISTLQTIIGKLVTAYESKRLRVIDDYRRYEPSFATDIDRRCESKEPSSPSQASKRKKSKKMSTDETTGAAFSGVGETQDVSGKSLREIAPDIFFSTYSRNCAHLPKITNDPTSVGDRVVMKFPVYGESIPRYYYCDSDESPFPGLFKNVLKNRDKFPFVPCCYRRDQRTQTGSNYKAYFDERVAGSEQLATTVGEGTSKTRRELQSISRAESRLRHVQQIYTTGKILLPGVLGILPKRIQEFFTVVDREHPAHQFVRKGVTRSKRSFIECVMIAKGLMESRASDAERRVNEQFDKILGDDKYLVATKQELYDESIADIRRRCVDGDTRASLFARCVEARFSCNVFVFGPGTDGDGDFVIPRHAKSYVRFDPTVMNDTIFVFEHYGTESDRATYPQCELIVRTSQDDPTGSVHTTSFSNVDIVVDRTFRQFLRMTRYSINGLSVERVIPPVTLKNITSQKIDDYGKCRALNVAVGTGGIIECTLMLVDPIPPLAVGLAERIYRVDGERARQFVTDNPTVVAVWQKRRKDDGRVREIGLDIQGGRTKTVMLVDTIEPLANVRVIDSDSNANNSDANDSTRLEYESFAILTSSHNDNDVYKFSRAKQFSGVLTAYGVRAMSTNVVSGKMSFNEAARRSFEIDDAMTIASKQAQFPVTGPNFVASLDDGRQRDDNGLSVTRKDSYGRIVYVPSVEVWRRLVFFARLLERYHPSQFREYIDLTEIPNYYDDPMAFSRERVDQYTVFGQTALERFMNIRIASEDVWTTVRPKSGTDVDKLPYYFRNYSVYDGILFIAQVVDDLSYGEALVRAWMTLGYNAYGSNELMEFYLDENQIAAQETEGADVSLVRFGTDNSVEFVTYGTLGSVGAILGSRESDDSPVDFVALLRLG